MAQECVPAGMDGSHFDRHCRAYLMSDRHVVRGDEVLQDHVHRGIASTLGVTGKSVFDECRFIDFKAGTLDYFLTLQSVVTANWMCVTP
jgi:hypothetical protein